MINTQLLGATQYLKGASFLQTKAIVNIREGFLGVKSNGVGVSNEYIDLGDFEVADYQYGGPKNQRVSLNLHSQDKRPIYNNTLFTKQFVSSNYYIEKFDDEDNFYSNWQPRDINDTYGISFINSSAETAMIGVTASLMDFIYTAKEFSDFRISAKIASGPTVALVTTGVFFHSNQDISSHYGFGIRNNRYELTRRDGNGTTILTGVSATLPSANTYSWVRVEERFGNLKCYYSSDGNNYTLGASYFIGEQGQTMHNGYIGLKLQNTGLGSIKVDEFEVMEYGPIYNKEDIIKYAYSLVDVNDVSVESQINGVCFLNYINIGGSYVYGSSNNVFLQGNSNAQNFTLLSLSGLTLSDFTVDIEFRGVSSSQLGVFITAGYTSGIGLTNLGTSARWLSNQFKVGSEIGHSQNNSIIQYIGTSIYTQTAGGDFWQIQPNEWYKLRVVKDGWNILWLVNNVVVNFSDGVCSLLGVTSMSIGVMSRNNVGVGASVEFRNFRISQLNDIVQDIGLEPGSKVQSLIDRVLPYNFITTRDNSNNINIKRFGNYGVSLYIGDSDYITSSSYNIDNTIGSKSIVTRIGDFVVVENNNNNRVERQMSDSRNEVLIDSLTQTVANAIENAKNLLIYNNKDIESISINLKNIPQLQQYDTVNFVNSDLGVSKNLTITDIRKNYDFESNDVSTEITLNHYNFEND